MPSNLKLFLILPLLVSFYANSLDPEKVESETPDFIAPPPTDATNGAAVALDSERLRAILKQIQPVDLDSVLAKQIAEEQNITLTPEMIIALRKLLAEQELAFNQPVANVNLLVNSERLVLSSIQPPISLNVKRGFDTFVEFYDLAGNPWPVERGIAVGSSEQFTAVTMNDLAENVPSNIVRVNASTSFGDTTMTVQLRGVRETVNFRLVHNQLNSDADYKRVFTVPLINSDIASTSMANQQSAANVDASRKRANAFLKAANESFEPFFTGDVPTGAISIPVLEGDASAWMFNGFLYVRSRIELLTFPTDQHGKQSFSGWYVHKMAPFPQITYYKDSRSLTIILDDDALMSAVNQQRIMQQQLESVRLDSDFLGG